MGSDVLAREVAREACAQHIEREMYQLDTGEVAAMGPLEHYNVVLREMADSLRART